MESVLRTFGELFPQPAEAPPFWTLMPLLTFSFLQGLALDAMVLPRPDETEKALEIHYALHPIVDLMFVETNPAPIKNVLWRAGQIASEHVRPPLVSPTPPGLVKIDKLLVEGSAMLEGPLADLAADVGSRP